jgi:hypothetical protein
VRVAMFWIVHFDAIFSSHVQIFGIDVPHVLILVLDPVSSEGFLIIN